MPPININIDFSALGSIITNALISGVQALLSPLPTDFVKWLLTQLQRILGMEGAANVLTHVPTELTTASGDVLELWRVILPFQLGLTAIVLAIQGYRVTQGRADIWDVVGRCAILIAFGQGVIFWGAAIFTLINAMSDGVSQSVLDLRNETLPSDFSIALMLIVAVVMAVLAWIKGVVGVVFLKVLLVSAPMLFSLSALPVFEGLVQWWLKEFTVWTLRPFMVALVLRLGLSLGTTFGGPLQFMLAIVAFWMAWTMDVRLRQFSVGAWGSATQFGLLSRGVRLAVGAFAGGGAGASAAAAVPATRTAGGTP